VTLKKFFYKINDDKCSVKSSPAESSFIQVAAQRKTHELSVLLQVNASFIALHKIAVTGCPKYPPIKYKSKAASYTASLLYCY